jgi:metallo-beta-lactamase class B
MRARTTDQEGHMNRWMGGSIVASTLGLTLSAAAVPAARAQSEAPLPAAVQTHVDAARKAAGQDFAGVFNRVCGQVTDSLAPPRAPAAPRPRRTGPPERSTWHAEPAKVFDNLYFLGQTEYSVWAVTTSDGIIVIDTIFDYSVEDEVVGGLKKLGLDPATIKYAIVSHGHSDHSGGAKYLQDHFGTRVILSAADWDLLDRSSGTKPKRDMVATDGMKLTLGDTTLTLYVTPGHTLGTISTIIPVTDNGTPHVVAEWGGTAFNWMSGSPTYITPEHPPAFWFSTYSASAERFRDIAARAGADVLIANHSVFDGSKTKIPALATRKAGEPHPYVIGKDAVGRYLTVVDECAQAGLATIKQG